MEGLFGLRRTLYKRVAEYSVYSSPDVYSGLAGRPFEFLVGCGAELANRLSRVLDEPITATDLLIDAPPPHREVEFRVDIHYPSEDIYRPLAEVSPVVEALARTQFDDSVKRVRIFAHPRCAERVAAQSDLSEILTAVIDDAAG